MQKALPTTGTSELLEQLSPFIPDDFINQLMPPHRGPGRRSHWSSAQFYRLLLLTLLTHVNSFNLMLALLPEQRAWRRFARLPNRHRLPVASQLHEFREAAGPTALRRINAHLLCPLLEAFPPERMALGLMDATDLPAATSAFKKRLPDGIRREERLWEAEPSKPV